MRELTNKQIIDSGMAFVLLTSGIGFLTDNKKLWLLSLVLLLINMTKPKIFHFPAIGWFKFSEMLGAVSSRIILSIIFFFVLLPIAFLKRTFSSEDNLKLKEWKKDNRSVFVERNHQFEAKDLTTPF